MVCKDKSRVLGVLLVILATVACGPKNNSDSAVSVIGGRPGPAPAYFAALHEAGDESPFCGATLIRPNVLMTAAHCTTRLEKDLYAWLGMSSLAAPPEALRIAAILRHPRYHSRLFQHDLALLFLEEDAAVPPIAGVTGVPLAGSNYRIYGFGNTSRGEPHYPERIQVAEVQELPTYQCQALGGAYGTVIEEQICAGDWERGEKDSCDGDSGGPLVLSGSDGQDRLYGLVSWGTGCGQPGRPGVYTRLAAYEDWIEGHIREVNAQGLPIEEVLEAVYYTPLYVEREDGSRLRFSVAQRLWKASGAGEARAALGRWQKQWAGELLDLQLHSRGPHRYEFRAQIRGTWWSAPATFTEL